MIMDVPVHGLGTRDFSSQFNVNSPNQDHMNYEIADVNVNDEAGDVLTAAEVL
jgi:hypothetical protein